MRRSLFGAYADHTGLIKKLVRERRWDVGPANREPLCDLSCTFGQRLFLQADTRDAFSPELPQAGSTPGWGRWSRCQRRLQQQMLEPGMLLPPTSPAWSSCSRGQDPPWVLLRAVPFPKQRVPGHNRLSVLRERVDGEQGHPVLLRRSGSV